MLIARNGYPQKLLWTNKGGTAETAAVSDIFPGRLSA
jgi:hypothetical protein